MTLFDFVHRLWSIFQMSFGEIASREHRLGIMGINPRTRPLYRRALCALCISKISQAHESEAPHRRIWCHGLCGHPNRGDEDPLMHRACRTYGPPMIGPTFQCAFLIRLGAL